MLGCLVATSQAAGQHPHPRYLDQTIRPTATIRLANLPSGPPFRTSAPRVRIGAEAGPPEVVFGALTAAAFVPNGALVVLDGSASELRMFGADGRFQQRFGRTGGGPGEFDHPQGLAADQDGRLYVSDFSRSVQRFDPTPAGYRPVVRKQQASRLRCLCVYGDQLVANALLMGDPRVLARYPADLGSPTTFAPLYASPNAGVNAQYGEGFVACAPDQGLVYFLPRSGLGEIRAYRADQSLAWRTVIEDFKANIVRDRADGYDVEVNPEGVNSGASLTYIAGIGLVVQVSSRSPKALAAGDPSPAIVYTLVLDPASGRLRTGGQGIPRILAARAGIAALGFEEPFPRVEVVAVSRP